MAEPGDAAGIEVCVDLFGPAAVIRVRGDVDLASAPELGALLDAVIDRGYVARGWLGASMQTVRFSDAATSKLGFDGGGGLVVLDVEHDSPAAQGGVMIGDVLVRIDATRITKHDDVMVFLGSDRVGTTVQLQVVRGGQVVIVPVTIGERPRTSR